MEIKLGIFELSTTNIFDFTSEDVIDVFAFKKYAMKKLGEMGHSVLPAGDFENIMLRYFYAGRTVFDKYLRTKLGKKPRLTEQENLYAKKVTGWVGVDSAKRLLHLCRVSSYLGGPGSPDFVARKDGAVFFYVGSEFLKQQELFMLLLALMDFDVQVLPTDGKEFSFDAKALVEYMLMNEKSARQQKSIEEALAALRQEVPTRQTQDATSYLDEEKSMMPFGLLEKWLGEGSAKKEDLLLLFERIDYIMAKRDREFEGCIAQLRTDQQFRAFGPARDEATMRRKAAYIEEKFGICDVKSKDLLNFV